MKTVQILIDSYKDRIKYLDKELHTEYAYYQAEESRWADEREVELLNKFIKELEGIKEEIENEQR